MTSKNATRLCDDAAIASDPEIDQLLHPEPLLRAASRRSRRRASQCRRTSRHPIFLGVGCLRGRVRSRFAAATGGERTRNFRRDYGCAAPTRSHEPFVLATAAASTAPDRTRELLPRVIHRVEPPAEFALCDLSGSSRSGG